MKMVSSLSAWQRDKESMFYHYEYITIEYHKFISNNCLVHNKCVQWLNKECYVKNLIIGQSNKENNI